MNYPILDAPDEDEPITEGYMLRVAKTTIKKFEGVPDLACKMLVKIMKMLVACIEIFPQALDQYKAPWTRFLEGTNGLCWNLQSFPTSQLLMGFFARLQFMPTYYMMTFEEAHYTRFFESGSHIFGPFLADIHCRFVAF